jgi:ribosome-associated protein
MNSEILKERKLDNEFLIATSRSSGPGGQNVNKVNTKVKVLFDVKNSSILSDDEKTLVCLKLKNRINAAGELTVTSQSERTQLRNRNNAVDVMLDLIAKALTLNSKRIPTAPTKASQDERLEAKHKRSTIKKLRRDEEED